MEIYHLTPSKNRNRILKEGLRADSEGNIFLFTDLIVANEIAKNQVFTERYCVFRILRSGIKGPLLEDNVAEYTRSYHRILKQENIEPRFLRLIREEKVVTDRPTVWDYLVGLKLGKTEKQIEGDFAISAWGQEESKKGKLSRENIIKEMNKKLKLLYHEED